MPKDPTHTTADDEPAADPKPDASQEQGSSHDVTTPFSPHEDDDSAFGDSDQHSTA